MNEWKKTVVLLIVGICVAAFVFGYAMKNVQQGTQGIIPMFAFTTPTITPTIQVNITPTENPDVSLSDCPQSGWLDCMPSTDGAKGKMCSKSSIAWLTVNCPDFQGVAY